MSRVRAAALLLLLLAPCLAACGREAGTRGAYVGSGAGVVPRSP